MVSRAALKCRYRTRAISTGPVLQNDESIGRRKTQPRYAIERLTKGRTRREAGELSVLVRLLRAADVFAIERVKRGGSRRCQKIETDSAGANRKCIGEATIDERYYKRRIKDD